MRTIKSLIIICLAAFINSCILFKKEIPKPVVIKIITPENFAIVQMNANYSKYVSGDAAYYQAQFMNGFMNEAKITKNVTIDNNALNPDFILEIKKITVTESDFTQTVNDAKSENNGKEYLLNKVECYGEVDCIDGKTNKKIGMSCTNVKSKQEKLKNNRNLGDLISGTNKDRSTYRQKLLRDDIARQLTDDVGRRVWVPISKRIKKSLK
ncbi:MAG: hypothetical protein ACK50A_17250 [Sphingobacteriaceae bacterium]